MNSYLGKHFFKVACICFVGFVVIAAANIKTHFYHNDTSQAEAASQIGATPTTRSAAPGFPIINVVGNQRDGYQVTLRNEYDRSIVAFQLGAGRGRITRDLVYQNDAVRPGDLRTEFYGYEPVLDTQPLTLFGVVFEDGSGDGQAHAVQAIKEMRLGTKMQLAQFGPILERALKSPQVGSSESADALWSATNSLPLDVVDSFPSYVKFGFHNERQRLLSEIQQIKIIAESGVSLEQRTQNQVVTQLLKFRVGNEERNTRLANRLIQ